jgi:hypothetical protein
VIRFFSGNNPLNVLILFFLGILIKLPYFLAPVIPQQTLTDGFFYLELIRNLKPAGDIFPGLYPILAYLLLFTQAVTFNGLINSQKLFSSPNLLLALAYLLITSIIPSWNVLSPGLIINSVMVWAWPKMVGLYHNPKPKGNLFNLGFGFGICSFVYFPSVYFLVLLIVALLLFRSVDLSEWLVTIVGVLTPFYFLVIYFFVWDRWQQVSKIIPSHRISLPVTEYNWKFWADLVLINLPLLIGVIISQRFSERMVVHVRKSWSFMLFYLLVALFLPFINSNAGFSHFIMAIVPISIFHAAFYAYPRKKSLPELFVWLTLIWVYTNYFMGWI